MQLKHLSILIIVSTVFMLTSQAQNVGINTNTPEYMLDVRGSGSDTGGVLNLANQDVSHFMRFFSGRAGDPNPFIWWHEGDPLRFAVGDGVGTFKERMIIRSGGFVGIGKSVPVYPLEVNQPTGVSLPSGAPVILGEYTGTALTDAVGIKGYSKPADYYGIGGLFEGGYRGVEARVSATGSNFYSGVLGEATGGTGTNVGIYGYATGGGTNWAGYFEGGNVYLENRFGVGQLLPEWPIDVSATQGVVRLVTTTSSFGSVLELRNLNGTPAYLGAINFNNAGSTYPGQLGYTGDNAMTFRVNGAEQVRVKSNGYLGIGSVNPESWVDIWRNSSSAVPLLTLREADIDYARMNFKMGLLPFEWSVKALPAGVSADADFLIQYKGETIDGTRLQIKGTGQVIIPEGLDASYSSNGFLMLGAPGVANVLFDNNEILARNNGAAASLSIQRDGGDLVLCELENGRVRIGTTPGGVPTDPAYLLAIGGKAICEELKVQLQGSWPDYVFNNDYSLMPLEQLEREIQHLGHLPDVPSAEEVQAEGIEIGEMQRIMMQKIEELTIYVIQLKKENEILAMEIATIRQHQ